LNLQELTPVMSRLKLLFVSSRHARNLSNTLNKQSQTVEKGWYSSLVV